MVGGTWAVTPNDNQSAKTIRIRAIIRFGLNKLILLKYNDLNDEKMPNYI